MQNEYKSLLQKKTWTLIDMPRNQKVIPMQMGFSNEDSCIKKDVQGQGCSSKLLPSRLGLYFLINGQVCVLAIDITQDLDIIQFDIKTIFLYVDLHEKIQYMCHLKGLIVTRKGGKLYLLHTRVFMGLHKLVGSGT